MFVRFWGSRGSVASPLSPKDIEYKLCKALELASPTDLVSKSAIQSFVKCLPFSVRSTYSGNTTCLELRNKNNDLIIIDAGTGIRSLGHELMGQLQKTKEPLLISHVMTHTHWDHIQGLLFFVPLYIESTSVHMYSCLGNLEERLRGQQNSWYFPVPYDDLKARIDYTCLVPEKSYKLFGMNVMAKPVRHPGGNFSYKFEEDGKTVIFCSDAEFSIMDLDSKVSSEYIDFFTNADILIFDTQYTLADSLQKIDYGHSSANIAIDFAIMANVKKLILFHHEPTYSDAMLDEVYLSAVRYRDLMTKNKDCNLLLESAYDGLAIQL